MRLDDHALADDRAPTGPLPLDHRKVSSHAPDASHAHPHALPPARAPECGPECGPGTVAWIVGRRAAMLSAADQPRRSSTVETTPSSAPLRHSWPATLGVVVALAGGLAGLVLLAIAVVGTGDDLPATDGPALDGRGQDDVAAPGSGPAPSGSPANEPDAPWAAFATDPDGSVVRWDACQPVRWAFSPVGAPPGGREVVEEAVARVADATGLDLVDVGDVEERPRAQRPTLAADGVSWAPVLVGWVDDTATDLPLRRQDRGVALTVAVEGGAGRVLVTGQLALNAAWPLEPGFVERHTDWGAVVLHELGHVLGLDHVDAPDQLMHRDPGFGPVEWGAGDLAGLAAVGDRDGCRPGPPPSAVDVAPPATISD